ncbi:bidirectional sugar transporter N3-like [Euphorbia lathyris]|uniref:bidirectional sugar transporter N3-like n=1 Tax=Euphorbia lathyris TaxID=212925 RepID=UPI003313B2D6
MALDHHSLIFTFGILGNIISIAMFLSPMPTFIRVFKKKSTEGFQSIPYVVALLSCMLWIYYALLKANDYLLLSINSFGCLVEIVYIFVYILYAPKQARMLTLRLVFAMNFGGFLIVFILTHFFTKGPNRLQIVGWFCVSLSVVLFAAPLTIMRLVIRTKSVEFMPFTLSFFLTLSAVMWLLYGILLKDLYIGLPNIFGLVFGIAQMILYAIYSRNGKKKLSNSKEINPEEQRKTNGESVESLKYQVKPVDEISV